MNFDHKNPPPDPAYSPETAGAEETPQFQWPPPGESPSPMHWPPEQNAPAAAGPSIPPAEQGPTGAGEPPAIFSAHLAPPIPADLQVPWGWLDLVILVLIAIAGTFAVSLLLVMAGNSIGLSLSQLRSSSSQQSIFLIVNQVAISFVLLGYLALQMRHRFGSPFWHTIGWRKIDTGRTPQPLAYFGYVLSGFVFAILVQLSSAAVGTKAKLPIEVFFQDRRSALLLMLMGVLIAPVVEETIFRGYLYPVIARTFGITTGVFATGILFGLLHAPQLKGGWGQIGLLMVVGIVFTYARATRRSVLASYLLHVSYNGFLFIEFILASSGLRHLPGQ